MSCDLGEVMKGLENEALTSSRSQLILQPFHHFMYVTAHSKTLMLLHLCHSSFYNPPCTSQLILQPFCCFTYITAHSISPMSQLILQPFHHFTYVTAHSATLPSFQLRHRSFCNPSVASPTSQLILQPFRRFTYVTAHSATLPSLHLRLSSFCNPSVALPTSPGELSMSRM